VLHRGKHRTEEVADKVKHRAEEAAEKVRHRCATNQWGAGSREGARLAELRA
jgi:hypothetical protein